MAWTYGKHTCRCKQNYAVCFIVLLGLKNVEHCGGEPEQASTMATCT